MVTGMTPVIVHGDVWSANLLWRKQNCKNNLATIVDWQVY